MAAGAQEVEIRKKEEEIRKRDDRLLQLMQKISAEDYWRPNQETSDISRWNPDYYFAGGMFWNTDQISK